MNPGAGQGGLNERVTNIPAGIHFSPVCADHARSPGIPGSVSARDNARYYTDESRPGRWPHTLYRFADTGSESSNEVAFSVQLLLLLTLLSLAPSILILTTSFLRISIVLDFVKRALSLQQVPPTQVLNGIALFLTLFIMWPTFSLVYDNAYRPLANGELTVSQAYTEAEGPIRMFMYRQMSRDTSAIATFMTIAKLDKPRTLADVPTRVLVPAYILHELTVAFKIEFSCIFRSSSLIWLWQASSCPWA